MCLKTDELLGYGPGRRVFETRSSPMNMGLITPMNDSSVVAALAGIFLLLCCLTRAFGFGISITSSVLDRLQYNIAVLSEYTLKCVACLAFIALSVSMLPLLVAQTIPEKYRHSLDVLSSFNTVSDSIESCNMFGRGLSMMISYKLQIFFKSIKYMALSAFMRCVSMFDGLSLLIVLISPLTIYVLSLWSEKGALILYGVSYIAFYRWIKMTWSPPRRMTSQEFAIMSKRLRKERSKRRRQFNDMIEAMKIDPLRDPAARRDRKSVV